MPVAGEVILASDAPLDSGWQTGTVDSDWADAGTEYIDYRRYGNVVEVRVKVRRTTASGAFTVPTSGNVSNETVGTIDSAYAPTAPYPALVSGPNGRGAVGMVDANGRVKLAAVISDAGNIAAAEAISLAGTYLIDT